MAFLIPSIQFFFSSVFLMLSFVSTSTSMLLWVIFLLPFFWTWPYHVSWFCSISFITVSSNPICCLIVTLRIKKKLRILLLYVIIHWRERRLISKLYMEQKVKVRLDRGETRSVQIRRGVRQGCCLSPILFNLYSECLTNQALERFWSLKKKACKFFTLRNKIALQIIHTVKYADDLVTD